jgi:Tfp pilus assembly protein PilO
MPVTMQTKLSLPKLPKRESSAPRSQKERLWLIAGGLVAFVMCLIGYFFFISPQRSSTSDVNGQVADAQQQNAVLQGRINGLNEQNKNLARYQAQLAEERLALPAASGIPDFLRTLQSLGSSTLTDVTALTVGQPAAVASAPAQPTATSTTGAASTPTAAPTPTANAITAPAVYTMAISATVAGSPTALDKFLDQLQNVQPRAVLITNVTEAAGSTSGAGHTGGQTTLTLTMQAFVAPALPAAAATPSP